MKTKMNWCMCLLLTLLVSNGFAQTEQDEYMKVITERSDKIIAELGILDSITYYQARALVVNQYAAINAHHEAREAEIKKIKEKFAGQEALLDQTRATYEADEDASLRVLHAAFIKKLEDVLAPMQIEAVKNGMTYGVLPLTYRAFQEMIPTLKSEEKAWILLWLTEARELAMDAPDSKGKHQIFGKYKGRINNYLSKKGYDLQKEGDAWKARREAAKTEAK
ncbi:DUF3826 domain-containing protein [Sphingobacterium sp. SGR-19]|uniref:DUF3826 domain-containing protein n=1 Tax=Sphingobacterium sp. SGR-19 TaxID=2710886 RepID=UPI0019D16479|nr:DUF3826 domain-containing protein [Sphingobacterium sp. SGR-19]